MEENKSLYSWLFEESEEEKRLGKEIDELQKEYEESAAYKEYHEKMKSLYKKMSDERKARHIEGNKHRRHSISSEDQPEDVKIKSIIKGSRERREEEYQKLPQEIKDFFEKYKTLSKEEKKMFSWRYQKDLEDAWRNSDEELEKHTSPDTTEEKLDQLHYILVQTVLDFINENELTDLEEVSFSADSLQQSAKFGEWTPETDSFLSLYGYEKESEDKWSWVRRLIGKSF